VVTAIDGAVVASLPVADRLRAWVSADAGVTWSPVEAPPLDVGSQSAPVIRSIQREGDRLVAVVAGLGADLEVAGGITAVRPVGRVLFASTEGPGRWTSVEPCPPVDEVGPCSWTGHDVAGLSQRGDEVSTDGGESWDDIDLEPRAPTGTELSFESLDALPDGGWIAVIAATGDEYRSYLARSVDGRRWKRLVGLELCAGSLQRHIGRPSSLWNRWYVPVSCSGGEVRDGKLDADGSSVLAVADRAFRDIGLVPGAELDVAHAGDGVVLGGRLLVPLQRRLGPLPTSTSTPTAEEARAAGALHDAVEAFVVVASP
jgi:hypothetical protein